jgi:hypothetical protein
MEKSKKDAERIEFLDNEMKLLKMEIQMEKDR